EARRPPENGRHRPLLGRETARNQIAPFPRGRTDIAAPTRQNGCNFSECAPERNAFPAHHFPAHHQPSKGGDKGGPARSYKPSRKLNALSWKPGRPSCPKSG